jgi:hypothetical protein
VPSLRCVAGLRQPDRDVPRPAAPHQTQSAATDNPCDQEALFTCEVPSFKRIWTLSRFKFSFTGKALPPF